MIDWLTSAVQLVALLLGAWYLIDAVRKKPVSRLHLIGVFVLGAMVTLQLVVSIVKLFDQQVSGDMVMFIGYLAILVLVIPVAVLWTRMDRSHWSTAVVCGASLTVAAMMLRMDQLWGLAGA
ncbi:MAG TPA: hypothetical protein H9881_08640 [Candidatus Stackebrandtia excrementipullorum]|nr:hypothetical protein [Candidatus Stackebrandtia excrementipullorum]